MIFVYLCLGLFIYRLGSSMLIHANIGNAPWVDIAEGVSRKLGLSIGGLLFFKFDCFINCVPLKQKSLNWYFDEFHINFNCNRSANFIFKYFINSFLNQFFNWLISILLAGIGGDIYSIANLGPGSRDVLMTGLQKKF